MENKQRESLERCEKEQIKLFKCYMETPLVVALVILCILSIWGIIDPLIFKETYEYVPIKIHYGIFHLPHPFLCWCFWTIFGALLARFIYIEMKIAFSYKILKIIYLEKLLGDKIFKENLLGD